MTKWKIRQPNQTPLDMLANLGCGIAIMSGLAFVIWALIR